MNDTLTPERILDAAEDVLSRFGPRKTTVVDVARALNVSHGTVYRHFPSKAALRDAVSARWLHRISGPLAAIAEGPAQAPERLADWLDALVTAKRKKVTDDPEMFAAYTGLAEEAREVIAAHVGELIGHLAKIIADGQAAGAFRAELSAPDAAAAVFNSTIRFHHPAHAGEWADPAIAGQYETVRDLLIEAISA